MSPIWLCFPSRLVLISTRLSLMYPRYHSNIRQRISESGHQVNTEKIKVRATGSGQTIEVVVLSKRLDGIEVVIGEGVHSVRCTMTPTRNNLAYAGKALGREIVYERSREDVKGDLARAAGFTEYQR
jgi:hypothetical protein